MGIKQALYAGSFYPGNAEELRKTIRDYFSTVKIKETQGKSLRALIVPHAGYIYSGEIAAVGYKQLEKILPENITLLGPSHRAYFKGIAFADFDKWATPLGEIKINNSPVKVLKGFIESKSSVAEEHSVEVQVPFIQFASPKSVITPLVTGNITDYSVFIDQLKNIAKTNLFIISTDLSHYMPYETAVSIDQETIIKILNFEKVTHEEACGADGINILSGIAAELNWKPLLLDYRNSGDTAGDKNAVVGYCAIGYYN